MKSVLRWFVPMLLLVGSTAQAQTALTSGHDAALAVKLGADELGMRGYVFVLLKTGPNRVAAGAERDEMFRGHFANLKRLSDEGKLVLAGPFDGVDGWRGQMILAVQSIEEAKALVATDPVLAKGEMVAEYHRFYGSAALMQVPETHSRIAKKLPGG